MEYYEKLYANKLDNLEKFLEAHNLRRLSHEKLEILHRTITSKEVKSLIKNCSTMKSSRPDGFTGEFHQTIKEELPLIFWNSFRKIEQERALPSSIHEGRITMIPKPEKENYKKRKL